MARFKYVDGVRRQLTAEEEAQRDLQAEEWAAEEPERAFAELRQRRNRRLAETDHYGLSDAPMNEEMASYRAAPRDLPAQYTNDTVIDEITWPTKPE